MPAGTFVPGAGQTWIQQFKHPQTSASGIQAVTLTNNLSGGTQGSNVTNATSGGVSGNAFDSRSVGAGASLTFDNSVTDGHSPFAAKVTTTGTSSPSWVSWNSSLGTQNQVFFRGTYLFTAYPTSTNFRLTACYSSGNPCATFLLNSSGNLICFQSGGTNVFTSNSVVPLNQLIRIEGYVIGNSTNGSIELKYFASADSLDLFELQSFHGSVNTLGQITEVRYGQSSSGTNVGPYWMMNVGATNQGYMGPAVPAATTFVTEALPGKTWQRIFQHSQVPFQGVASTYTAGTVANVSVDSAFSDENITSAVAGTVANVTLSGTFADQAPALTITGTTATVNINATFPDQGFSLPVIPLPAQARPGQTWKNYFQHSQQSYPPSFNASVNSPSPSNVTVTAQTSGFPILSISGTPAVSTMKAKAGPSGAVTIVTEPGLTAGITVAAPSDAPIVISPTATANVSVDATFPDIAVTISQTVNVANVSTDSTFADINVQTASSITSLANYANPGTTWRRRFQPPQLPALYASFINVPGTVANVSTAAQAGSFSRNTIGTTASVVVSSIANPTVTTVGASSVVTMAAHFGSMSANILGSVASVTIASFGSISKSITGTAASVNVGASANPTVKIPGAVANVTSAANAGTISRNIIGTTANISVSAIASPGLGVVGVSSNITVTAFAGTVVRPISAIAKVTVTANPGFAGSVEFSGHLVTDFGKVAPREWSGFV